jgi:uncharacterized membrane protein
MDWGIVLSVLVALTLFVAGAITLTLTIIGLFVWRMKRHARKHGNAPFKFPGCPMMKSAHSA